jgi:glycosyltransferase involved in cell wall biosynthesis
MPAYNCARFIEEAVNSVRRQTYSNWELIIVDDCSTDNTYSVISEIALQDPRIKVLKHDYNMGAAASRNKAIVEATGKYIAFLDSDDIWLSQKLEKQIRFMKDNRYSFSCTSYNKIDENSVETGKIIDSLTCGYEGLLRRCPGNSTVIYDCEVLGKHQIPKIKKRNDYLMWLQVIKKAEILHGFPEVLGSHRLVSNSLSSKKTSLVRYHWIIYRDYEKLPVIKCIYLCGFWIAKSLFHIK